MSEPSEAGAGQPSLLDRTVKVLLRRFPEAFFRLVGAAVDLAHVRPDDPAVNLSEFRADRIFIVGEVTGSEPWALHIECQSQPDRRVLRDWFFKNAALTAQLEMEVILVAVYLTKGPYVTFPDTYRAARGALQNRYTFEVIRLWEHAERIRAGELPELAPLLVLCDDIPTMETLRQEREIILGLDVEAPARADLLAAAITVGSRYFTRDLLETLFREELKMLKEASIVEEWIEEACERARAEASARALAVGRAEGRAAAAREMLLRVLRQRFGELPAPVVARVESEGPEWCEEVMMRALTVSSLEELAL